MATSDTEYTDTETILRAAESLLERLDHPDSGATTTELSLILSVIHNTEMYRKYRGLTASLAA